MAIHRSQFINGAAVAAQRPLVERVIGVLLWCIGVLTTIVAISGGWDTVLSYPADGMVSVLAQVLTFQLRIPIEFFITGTLLQVLISGGQLLYNRREDWRFWATRGVDSFINWMALNPLLVGAWSGILMAAGVPDAWAVGLATVINAVLAWLVAFIPENSLVTRGHG